MEAAGRSRRSARIGAFSLRTLLVVIALTAVALAWYTNKIHRRRWAVALLESWNMSVVGGYHPFDEMRPIFWEGHVRPGLPAGIACQYIGSWQMRLRTCERDPMLPASDAEVESWMNAKHIKLRPPRGRERKQIVAAIAELKEVRALELSFELDDEDLTVLSCLSELEIFAFKTRGLTAAGVDELLKLPKLYALEIEFDAASELSLASVKELARHQRLKFLTLSGPILVAEATQVGMHLSPIHVDVQFPFGLEPGHGAGHSLHRITMLRFDKSFIP